SGQDDGVDIPERSGVVPHELGLLAEVMGCRIPAIVIAIAAWEHDHAYFHGVLLFSGNGRLRPAAVVRSSSSVVGRPKRREAVDGRNDEAAPVAQGRVQGPALSRVVSSFLHEQSWRCS